MGKIIYTCTIKKELLDDMLTSRNLPASFQNAVASQKLNDEKFDKAKKESHANAWAIQVTDNLKGGLDVTATPVTERPYVLQRWVNVECNFELWKEVDYFRTKGLSYLKKYRVSGGAARVEQELLKQLPEIVKEYISSPGGDLNLKPESKVPINLKYRLEF